MGNIRMRIYRDRNFLIIGRLEIAMGWQFGIGFFFNFSSNTLHFPFAWFVFSWGEK